MLTVYGRATSSNVQCLMWGLEELGVSYERVDRGEVYGGLDTEEFRDMNPHGKIPTVVTEDGTALFETAAILRYVSDRAGRDVFWPSDPLERAGIDMWAEWAKNEVAANFTGPVFWRVPRTRPDNRDQAAILQAVGTLESELAVGDAQLSRRHYLCGDNLTLADIMLGHILYRYFDIDIERRSFPNLQAYFDRLAERPAFRKTVMVSYDVLRNTF